MSGESAIPEQRPEAFVQSLERGLRVIRALGTGEPRSLSDVARDTGLTRAAARRFLITLEHLGYVRGRDGRFALTPRVLELGYAYLSGLSLPEVAQPHLERLVAELQESSSVSILDGDEVVYVARVATRRIMRVSINVGTRFPAYATSMGRVLLAGLSDDELDAALARIELTRLTDRTITAREALRREIGRVRRRGHALVDQELEPGLRSIAVPVRNAAAAVVAAVNVSAQASRTSLEELEHRALPVLLATAAAIERDLSADALARAR